MGLSKGAIVRVGFEWRVAVVFALTLATLAFAVAGALRLGRELAVCFFPVAGLVQRPLCSGVIWGHPAVPVVLLAASVGTVAVGTVFALTTAFSQLTGAARFRRRLLAAETLPDSRVAAAAMRLGLRARVVACPVPLAVTVGVWRSEVLLSDALTTTLSDEALGAVLHHEAWHVRKHHPAYFAFIRASAQAGALFPAISSLVGRAVLQAELEADQAAIDNCGRSAFVAALAQLAEGADPLAGSRTAFGSARGMLSDRIRILAGGTPTPTLSRADIGLSLIGLAIVATPLVGLFIANMRAGA